MLMIHSVCRWCFCCGCRIVTHGVLLCPFRAAKLQHSAGYANFPHLTRTQLPTIPLDPMRPGAGTENYGFEFQSDSTDHDKSVEGKGYLRKVKYKVDDQTITESAELLATSLRLVNAFSTSAQRKDQEDIGDLVATDCCVAYGRFDINSPTYECDVAAFLECHLNSHISSICAERCEDKMCK